MKLFPYILVRLTGLPFNFLEQLSFQSLERLDIVTAKYYAAQYHKKELLKLLENSSNEIHCGFVLKNLAYLKTNLLHGKKGKLSKKLESNLKKTEKQYLDKIENQLHLYNQDLNELKALEKEFEKLYIDEIKTQRLVLQKISKEPVLLNGLLMSSHSFLNQLRKYSQKDVDTFAKKQFQTERAFLKYLARICTKTSPFSTFSPLSVFSLETEKNPRITSKSVFRFNNYVFSLWRDALNNYPPFYRKLIIGMNPSLQKQGGSWNFLINTRNVESVQKMENNGMLDLIFEIMKSGGVQSTFEALIQKLLPTIDTDSESLEAFLLELIDYGFLEWRWAFSGLDPFWNKKLQSALESFDNHLFLKQFSTALDEIQQKIEIAEKSEFADRKRIQFETFEMTKRISEPLLKETQLADVEQVVDIEKLKLFKIQRFDFTPEKLFYEDVTIPFQSKLNSSEISKVVADLDQLLDYLGVLLYYPMQEELKQFFKENYNKNERIDLLSFYEEFYKNAQKAELESSQKAINLSLNWQQKIIEQSELTKDGTLKINLDLLKSLSKKNNKSAFSKRQASQGAFIQLFYENNQIKGFSETAFEGNGKMMGRFLHLFPAEITKTLIDWNEVHRNEQLWIENVDGSIYNPNLHPPLLNFEIRMPGSQNTLPTEKQISIDSLEIVYNESSDELHLIDHATNQRAFIFDLGFEALESRSPMYQLIATFGYPSPSQNILAEIVNNYFDKNSKRDIYIQPRICVGNHLIIQRKRWFVSKEHLPFKQNSESESGYFIRLNLWIQKHKIPSKVFVTISPGELKERGKENTDNYKPQYIDFQSSVFVQLFHKLIKKVENKLKIEEILPFPSENIKDQTFASEYLIQWETHGQKKGAL